MCTRIPVSRGFFKEHRKMGGVFCRGLFYQMSSSYLILGRKRFYRSCSWNRKKKFTVDAAKCVLLTVHAYPSPEVFWRSIGKWGGSFTEVYFIKCPHPTWSWGENGFKTVFVQIILPSKWTGVSLKVSRRNCQETGPCAEKVHQLFTTHCNRWHLGDSSNISNRWIN